MQEHNSPMTTGSGRQHHSMYSEDPEVVPTYHTPPQTFYVPSYAKQPDYQQPFLAPAPVLIPGHHPHQVPPSAGVLPQHEKQNYAADDANNNGSSRSRAMKIGIAALVGILILAIALGVGLGVGLGLRNNNGKGGDKENSTDGGGGDGGSANSTSTAKISDTSALTAASFDGPDGEHQRVVFYQDASNSLHISRYDSTSGNWIHVNVTDRLIAGGADEADAVAESGSALSVVARYVDPSTDYDDGQPSFVMALYYVSADSGTIVQAETSDIDGVADWSVGSLTSLRIQPVTGSTFSALWAPLFNLPLMSHSLYVQPTDASGEIHRWANGVNGTEKDSWLDTGAVTDVQVTQVGGRGALIAATTFGQDIRLYYTDKARVLENWVLDPFKMPWKDSMGGGTESDSHLTDNLSSSIAAATFDGEGDKTNIVLVRHGTNGQGIPIAWHDGEWRDSQKNPTFAEQGVALPASIKGDTNNSTAVAFSNDLSAYVLALSDGDDRVQRVWRFEMDRADPRTWMLAEEVPTEL